MERKQKLYQFWLHNLPDVGDAAIRRLLAAFGDAKSVYGASEKQLSQILKKETAEKIIGLHKFSEFSFSVSSERVIYIFLKP